MVDEQGTPVARMQMVSIFMGSGGVGRKGKCSEQILAVAPPNRSPDHVVEERTGVNQAAMFRLSGM